MIDVKFLVKDLREPILHLDQFFVNINLLDSFLNFMIHMGYVICLVFDHKKDKM